MGNTKREKGAVGLSVCAEPWGSVFTGGGKILEGKDLQHGKHLPGSPVLSGGTSAGRLQWVSLAPHWALNYS